MIDRAAEDHHTMTQGVRLLSERMRVSTKAVHDKSDRLVNFKLALVLTSGTLYGESISLFAAIFERLETILERQKSHKHLGRFHELLPYMRRSEGFRADMSYYLTPSQLMAMEKVRSGYVDGDGVGRVVSPPALENYLDRLDLLEKDDPIRLVPYIYHMYMAIFSGGYMIKKIVKKSMRLPNDSDDGVLAFCVKEDGTNMDVDSSAKVMNGQKIRKELKRIVDEVIAPSLCEDKIQGILEESYDVFSRNNAVVGSIKATSAFHSASKRLRNLFLLPTAAILLAAVAIALHPLLIRRKA